MDLKQGTENNNFEHLNQKNLEIVEEDLENAINNFMTKGCIDITVPLCDIALCSEHKELFDTSKKVDESEQNMPDFSLIEKSPKKVKEKSKNKHKKSDYPKIMKIKSYGKKKKKQKELAKRSLELVDIAPNGGESHFTEVDYIPKGCKKFTVPLCDITLCSLHKEVLDKFHIEVKEFDKESNYSADESCEIPSFVFSGEFIKELTVPVCDLFSCSLHRKFLLKYCYKLKNYENVVLIQDAQTEIDYHIQENNAYHDTSDRFNSHKDFNSIIGVQTSNFVNGENFSDSYFDVKMLDFEKENSSSFVVDGVSDTGVKIPHVEDKNNSSFVDDKTSNSNTGDKISNNNVDNSIFEQINGAVENGDHKKNKASIEGNHIQEEIDVNKDSINEKIDSNEHSDNEKDKKSVEEKGLQEMNLKCVKGNSIQDGIGEDDDSDSGEFDANEDSDYNQSDSKEDSDFDEDDTDEDFDYDPNNPAKNKIVTVQIIRTRRKRSSKHENHKKDRKNKKEEELIPKQNAELTEYEKEILQKREEKMAFLKSLKINEVFEDLMPISNETTGELATETIEIGPQKQTKIVKEKEVEPSKRSQRLVHRVPVNYCEIRSSDVENSRKSKKEKIVISENEGNDGELKESVPLKRSKRLETRENDLSERHLFNKLVGIQSFKECIVSGIIIKNSKIERRKSETSVNEGETFDSRNEQNIVDDLESEMTKRENLKI